MSLSAKEHFSVESPNRVPRVLVVEDDESMRFLLTQYLNSHLNIEIVCATCVAEGKIGFIQNQVDLVICDQNMGDGVGTEVLRFVRERNCETPFILFTAQEKSDLPDIASFKCCYIQKPAVAELVHEVVHHLGGQYGRA